MAALFFFFFNQTLLWTTDTDNFFQAIFSLMIIRFWIVKMRNTVLARHHSFTTIKCWYQYILIRSSSERIGKRRSKMETSTVFSLIHTSSQISFKRSHHKFCFMCAVFLFCSNSTFSFNSGQSRKILPVHSAKLLCFFLLYLTRKVMQLPWKHHISKSSLSLQGKGLQYIDTS